jgi:hypothetical protein
VKIEEEQQKQEARIETYNNFRSRLRKLHREMRMNLIMKESSLRAESMNMKIL